MSNLNEYVVRDTCDSNNWESFNEHDESKALEKAGKLAAAKNMKSFWLQVKIAGENVYRTRGMYRIENGEYVKTEPYQVGE